MALEVFPLTTAWSAGSVSWDAPWRQPGGDYQVIRGAYTRRGDESDQPARFNVSSAIRAVVNDGASDAGFILMPSRHAAEGTSPSGLPEAFATEVGALTGIKLVVFCASS
jgi:hypothetical protein